MESRFLAFQGSKGPAFLWGALSWSHTVALPYRSACLLQYHTASACALHFLFTSGEHYNPALNQTTYFAEERKRLVPNLIDSGKNLGEDSCFLTLNYDDYFCTFFKQVFFLPLCFLFIQNIHCVGTKSKCWESKRNIW